MNTTIIKKEIDKLKFIIEMCKVVKSEADFYTLEHLKPIIAYASLFETMPLDTLRDYKMPIAIEDEVISLTGGFD
jgi:hypothetical protein